MERKKDMIKRETETERQRQRQICRERERQRKGDHKMITQLYRDYLEI